RSVSWRRRQRRRGRETRMAEAGQFLSGGSEYRAILVDRYSLPISLLDQASFLESTAPSRLRYERHRTMAATMNIGKTKGYEYQEHHDATCAAETMAERTFPHVPHR